MPPGQYRELRDDEAMRVLMRDVLAPTSVCLDIGSNEGRILAEMLQFAPEGRHHAFEPIPSLAAGLRAKFPCVVVHECALSDQSGEATFHHALNLSGWSSLRRLRYPIDVTVQEIQVPLRRLDDLVPSDLPVRFIKIDVEGAELHVLRGGIETIRRWRPYIVFEYAEIHALLFGITPDQIYDCLTKDCGLVVRSLLGTRKKLTRSAFVRVCRAAAASHYSHDARGNFLAGPL